MSNKYLRKIKPADDQGEPINVDVYEVLLAFNVTCPATQHAIKKLLCAGIRGKGDKIQDLQEAIISISRAVEIAKREKSDINTLTLSKVQFLQDKIEKELVNG